MHGRDRRISFLASVFPGSAAAVAQDVPTRQFARVQTRIAQLEHRLQSGVNRPSVPASGSAVRYANGSHRVSYDELDTVQQSRNGDRVFICLVRLPQACPPGNSCGRVYTTTNLRTLGSWTMSDSKRACAGA
jgi:hypothetical protein